MNADNPYRGYKKLLDVKQGELFYGYSDNIIYKMIEITSSTPTSIKYTVQLYKSDVIFNYGISGADIDGIKVLMFKRRDRESFLAGFRYAIEHCKKHMGVFDLENAELNDDVNTHLRMLKIYKQWCENKI